MFSVDDPEGRHLGDQCNDPGNGIAQEQSAGSGQMREYGHDPQDPEPAGTQQGNDHQNSAHLTFTPVLIGFGFLEFSPSYIISKGLFFYKM